MRKSAVALPMLVIGSCGQAAEPAVDLVRWESYRQTFISVEGRVIDYGLKNITHSEGQGYAMILAEAADDYATFDRLWSWTRRHLQVRDDSLLAWKWDPDSGRVIDPNNATDADLLVAWALLRAARRWNAPVYRLKAWRLLHDIRLRLVIDTPTGPVLLPGTSGFIHDGVVTVNLSYWVFPALSEFDRLQPYGPWAALKVSGLKLLGRARFGATKLPADWVVLTTPLAPSPLFPARFGFEALRIVLYACWDGLCHHPGLGRLERFWLSNPNPPAWVNLDDGTHAPMSMRPGAMAVRELLLKTDGGAKVPARPAVPGKDYYDSTLGLLANLAANEQS